MAISKVAFSDGTVHMDITDSTVTADTLANGVVAYGADGERIVGNMTTVTETYRNGNQWYRKWSDGFIEQGGTIATSQKGYESITISLPTAFTTTTYTVLTGGTNTGNLGSGVDVISEKTTTGFKTHTHHKGDALPTWYACGY